MRKSLKQLTENIYEQLESCGLDLNDIETIITTEIVLTVFKDLAEGISAKEAWSMIPGYNEPILLKVDLTKVARLRILLPQFRNSKGWEELLEDYTNIDLSNRCYEIDQEGKFKLIEPRIVKSRINHYEQILREPIERQQKDKVFAKAGKFSYRQKINQELKEFAGEIPEHLIAEGKQILPYRPKKLVSLVTQEELLNVAKEMDEKLPGDNWQERVSSFNLRAIGSKDEKKGLFYKENIHVAGGLGAGKSSYMLVETYRLVKHHGARVGFIEASVEQVIKRVATLKKLGIKAVPIIGLSNRNKHMEQYVAAHCQQNIDDVSEWGMADHEVLQYLSGKCLLKAFADDLEPSSYPCEKVWQDNKRKICPLYQTCGVHKALNELAEADVWVATVPAIIKSRLRVFIDSYNRTYYEAMYDLLDIVFVDEADKVQQEFEQAFIADYDLIGGDKHLFESLFQQSNEYIGKNYQSLASTLVSNWQLNLDHLKTLVDKIYHVLSKYQSLRSYLRNEIFHVYRLSHVLCKKLAKDEYLESIVYKSLKDHIDSPTDRSPFVNIVDELLRSNNNKRTTELLEEALEQMKITLDNKEKKQLLYAQLEFFLYLARIDYYFRYLIHNYPYISSYVGFDHSQSQIFQKAPDDLRPFLKDGMTGMLLGYRYYIPDGETVGTFKLVEYSGVGRQLLQEWHSVYEIADNKQGPAVVFLSGTSYAPGSYHYHLNIPVSILLASNKPAPTIEMQFSPVYDHLSNQGKPIYISGISDRDKRAEEITKMVNQLKNKFQDELDYWKGRKVLIVVNSYEDTEAIAEALKYDTEWNERFKVISKAGVDDYHYAKTLIESLPRDNIDLLAVPLTAMGRGYNILSEDSKKSYFGSVFFLIRPYTVPGDMVNMIQILHAKLPLILSNIQENGQQFEKAIKSLRSESIKQLEMMVRKPDYWTTLKPNEREVLAWYTFVLIWQMIGRLMRGGTNARIFFVDSKFSPNRAIGESDSLQTSLLNYWQAIMAKNSDDEIFQALYNPFIKGINNLQ